jgi:hypothetical protein
VSGETWQWQQKSEQNSYFPYLTNFAQTLESEKIQKISNFAFKKTRLNYRFANLICQSDYQGK